MVWEGKKTKISDIVNSFNRDEREMAIREKAIQMNLPYYDSRQLEISPDVLSYVSKEEAAQGVIPISKKGKQIVLGIADLNKPEARKIAEELNRFIKVKLAIISWESAKELLPHYAGLKKHNLEKHKDYEILATDEVITFSQLIEKFNSAPIQDILKFIVSAAIENDASDIHFEPKEKGAQVRFRIDGVLHIIGELNEERFKYVLSQIELASGLKLNVNEAQQGRLEVIIGGKDISVRVETMPTLYGDDISLRIFNEEAVTLSLEDLGLYDYHKTIIEDAIQRPQGMILVVGPTGAGKTSTIYAVLNKLNKPEIKIVTLEDPIEYSLNGITQSQINEGESYYTRLKAVLREDPDIVMVGEIRDSDTVDVALHAALTGHVMISTFHATNATTAISLLKQISKDNTLLATALNIIVAQRLVRRICPDCKKEYTPQGNEAQFVQKILSQMPDSLKAAHPIHFYKSVGCDKCSGIGYKGRIAIFEILVPSVDFQKLIYRNDITQPELQTAARQLGMITMEEDGLLKALDGVTSVSEVMKAVRE